MTQYRNLNDEEFDARFTELVMRTAPDKYWEDRIAKKMKEFEDAYDLTDMKPNDNMLLRSLIESVLRLTDFENIINKLTASGVTDANINLIRQISSIQKELREGISKMQDDLKISRKIRKSDKEVSAMDYLEGLKTKAKKFYESKVAYVFCTKCGMLLGTVWYLYPDAKNKFMFTCHRELENGEKCLTRVEYSSKELDEMGKTNRKELLAEGLR